MVFHLGPLAPRPELGHVDTEGTETRRPSAEAGRAAGTDRGRCHDPAGGGHRRRRRRPGRHRRRRRSGTCSPTAVRRPAASPSSTRRASAPGSPPSATSTRRRTVSTAEQVGTRRPVHPVRAGRRRGGGARRRARPRERRTPGGSGCRWAPRSAAPPAWSTSTSPVSERGAALGRGPPARPGRICTGRSRPARSPPRSPSRSAPRARCRPSPPAAPPGSTRSATPSTLIEEGRADVVHRRRLGLARSPRSPWPASTPSRRPRRTTTTRSTPPGRSTPTATASSGRGRRRARPGGAGARPRPRRAHLLRDRRLRHLRQRLPHDRPAPARAWRWPRRSTPPSTRPGSTATQIDYVNAHGSGTKQNDRHETAAVKRSLGDHAYETPDELHQVDGRATRSARSARSRSPPASLAIDAPGRAADGELRDPRPRVRPGLRAAHRPRAAAATACSRSAAGSAASRPRCVLTRPSGRSTMSCPAAPGARSSPASASSPPTASAPRPSGRRRQEGISVLDRVTREGCEHLPLRVAGEVRGFDPAALIEERYLVQTDRFTHFALAAADLALDDARLGRADYDGSPFAMGVVTAAGSGGGEFGQRELQRLWGQGSRYVGPYQSIAWFYAASTGQISIRGGCKGPLRRGRQRRGRRPGRARARRAGRPRAAPTRSSSAPPRRRWPRTRSSASSATRS